MEKRDGAPSTRTSSDSKRTEKHPATPEQSKKRQRSSETTEVLENPTSKRRRIIQDWSDEDEENDPTADLLNPHWRKDVEQMVQEGAIETSSGTSAGNADSVNRCYITCATTK
jgi:hypothetical protein